jgi:cyclomaltodextrinase
MINNLTWAKQAVFYHIYPLGLCGAPRENDFISPPVHRLEMLQDWIPHIKALGCNALYLGPLFESDFHGYDTADYFQVDRRLGTNEALKSLCNSFHESNIRVVLDTVFNHVGRNFWAFQDLQANGESSRYKEWFAGVDFSRKSPYGDGFVYEGWYDAYNLVRLNLRNDEVKEYLLSVVAFWMDEFNLDGLRLDVAEIMDKKFLAELAAFCHSRHPDFWLMGEMIHGDYNQLANDNILDSATNYEAYKALYSSHNDNNYFELAYTFNRQFGEHGMYKDLYLYNFVDNHDTTRASSILKNEAHLFLLYVILYTMPGIPSLYYGSEWGQKGVKGTHDDYALRPEIKAIPEISSSPITVGIQLLAQIRQKHFTLQSGCYVELQVHPQQFVYLRKAESEIVIIALNSSEKPASMVVQLMEVQGQTFQDELDLEYVATCSEQELLISNIPSFGARIMSSRTDIRMAI